VATQGEAGSLKRLFPVRNRRGYDTRAVVVDGALVDQLGGKDREPQTPAHERDWATREGVRSFAALISSGKPAPLARLVKLDVPKVTLSLSVTAEVAQRVEGLVSRLGLSDQQFVLAALGALESTNEIGPDHASLQAPSCGLAWDDVLFPHWSITLEDLVERNPTASYRLDLATASLEYEVPILGLNAHANFFFDPETHTLLEIAIAWQYRTPQVDAGLYKSTQLYLENRFGMDMIEVQTPSTVNLALSKWPGKNDLAHSIEQRPDGFDVITRLVRADRNLFPDYLVESPVPRLGLSSYFPSPFLSLQSLFEPSWNWTFDFLKERCPRADDSGYGSGLLRHYYWSAEISTFVHVGLGFAGHPVTSGSQLRAVYLSVEGGSAEFAAMAAYIDQLLGDHEERADEPLLKTWRRQDAFLALRLSTPYSAGEREQFVEVQVTRKEEDNSLLKDVDLNDDYEIQSSDVERAVDSPSAYDSYYQDEEPWIVPDEDWYEIMEGDVSNEVRQSVLGFDPDEN
jgi:hypothetical protein